MGPCPRKGALGKMDAQKLLTDPPPQGKEHRMPEMYYKSVLKGADTIAGSAPKMYFLSRFAFCYPVR